jgi:hypothetical protein
VTHQTDPEQRSVALDVAPCPEDAAADPAAGHDAAGHDAAGHDAADHEGHCPDGCCGSGTVELTVPEEEGLTPAGWYMLVVLDDEGVPSPARWVHVG